MTTAESMLSKRPVFQNSCGFTFPPLYMVIFASLCHCKTELLKAGMGNR